MLVISNFKKGDTVTIKLSTGEELVARFDADTGSELKIVKPTVLTLNPQSGQAMLIPWLMSIDAHDNTPIVVNKSQIVAVSKPIATLSNSYLESTTGIAKAEANLIL